ncbi:hypothetical protein [Hyalangium sp.]|uniref:hypothetical protein n=1 Tax=Hyalangium sp. TaxID=2028555 RepID=UPI002D559840|nr:hypothetical protein [Hyalangium sp.]HYH99178.1 hypothetical protein [Hyalangium sp.]
MLSKPGMNRFVLFLSCLLPLLAGAQGGPPDGGPVESVGAPDAGSPPDAGPAGTAPTAPALPTLEAESCQDTDEASEALPSALGTLQLRVDGQAQTLAGIEWKGLQRLTVDQVRTLSGLPATGPLTVEQATRGLRRLARTDLFANLTPTLRLAEGSAPTLEVTVEEHPFVASLFFQGLQDLTPRELREHMFRSVTWEAVRKHDDDDNDDDDDDEVVATLRISEQRVTVSVTPITPTCPPLRPPREWFVRLDAQGELQPGIVSGGLTAALERVLSELRDDGYLLASLSAVLHPDGRLEVELDEGHIEGVDVEGVDADQVPRIREALGIQAGDIFLRSDMSRAVARMEERLPYLQVRNVERRAPKVQIVEERTGDGARRYRTVREEEQKPRRERRRVEVDFPWEDIVEVWWGDDDEHGARAGLGLRGRRVVVNVRPRRPDFDLGLLPVHTQVTGLAPGLEGKLRVWDPGDRAHVTLETAFFIPLRLGGQHIPDDPEQTRRQRRLNWLLGAKARVPSLGLAELGGQIHDFTDTMDRWRISPIDSYIYSALLNRPDADYFRRKGVAAFATWRLGNRWLLGGEYRRDSYASMVSLARPLSVFRRDSLPFPNAPVTEARFGSLVGRLEYASDGRGRDEPGSLFRSPELPLLSLEDEWPARLALRSFVTVEVARPSFGGDEGTRFWKLVSDTLLYVPTRRDDALRLRLRAAGGEELPLQKQEGLGGWSALRGYAFKEFRGDASVLASAEYRWGFFGAFADVGTVRQETGWTDARLGVGVNLHFGDEVELTTAWRADERASWVPEARLLFTRPF